MNDEQLVKAALSKAAPRGTGALPDYLEFFRAAFDFIGSWRVAHDKTISPDELPFVIVFSERPDFDELILGASGTARYYRADVTKKLQGRLLIANINLENIRILDDSFSDLGKIFEFIEKIEKAPHSFVVAYPGKPLVGHRFPTQSVAATTTTKLVEDHAVSIDKNVLISWLNEIHVCSLRGPNAGSNQLCWIDPKTFQTVRPLELVIQSTVYVGLLGYARASAGDTLFEMNVGTGRVDLAVIQGDAVSGMTIHVIEVKALREKQSLNFNTRWAKRGVRQADGYRTSLGSTCDDAYALIYDCRKNNKNDFPDVILYAEEKNVEYLHYPIYTKDNIS